MNNKRATKRALLTSVTALVMCVVMLVGTTFAWFTDTASTGVNKIQAGNLKMEVTYKNAETVKNPLTDTKFEPVTKETPVFNNNAIWEPGHVEYVVLKISNAGTLALKYKLGINIASETGSTNVFNKPFKLSDYIEFAVIDGDKSNLGRDDLVAAATAAGNHVLNVGYTNEDHLLAGATGSEKTVTLVVWMPKSVGNEANYKVAEGITAPSIDLGINVAATQYTYEKDSFDETYDKNAQYPEVSYAQVSSQVDLNNALKDPTDANGNPTKKVAVELKKAETFTLDNGIANEGTNARDITFVGDGTQTVDVVKNAITAEGGELNYQRGSTFTFENMTIQAGEGSFDGIVCDELTYKNCTIKGKLTLYGKATFINGTFDNTMANQYSIWTWGGTDVTFEGCTFNTNGKAILLYGQATASNPTNLVVNNCTFNDRNNGAAGKAAIEIGNDYNATYTLTVNNATVNGFADGKNTGSKLWANKNSMDAAHLTVTIDGNKVQ